MNAPENSDDSPPIWTRDHLGESSSVENLKLATSRLEDQAEAVVVADAETLHWREHVVSLFAAQDRLYSLQGSVACYMLAGRDSEATRNVSARLDAVSVSIARHWAALSATLADVSDARLSELASGPLSGALPFLNRARERDGRDAIQPAVRALLEETEQEALDYLHWKKERLQLPAPMSWCDLNAPLGIRLAGGWLATSNLATTE